MTKLIDDLIVLGRSAPEPLKKSGRHTICLAGWSESMGGFVRLYPTSIRMGIQRWSKVEVPVEKDLGHDHRTESYKIEGSRRDWENLHEKIIEKRKLKKSERMQLIDQLPKKCPILLHENSRSLGIVSPTICDSYLKEIEKADRTPPIHHLFQDQPLKSKKSYPYQVRIKYACQECASKQGFHDQQCMEWGIYRFWEKNPDADPRKVIDNLRILDDDYRTYLVIGNLLRHPKSFSVISVIRFKESEFWKRNTLFS